MATVKLEDIESRPATIILNGFWAKIAQGVLVAAILAGASGLGIALKMSYAQDSHSQDLLDHEARIRIVESRIGEINQGIGILLERTDPKR